MIAAIHAHAGTGAAHPLWGAFALLVLFVVFIAASVAASFAATKNRP